MTSANGAPVMCARYRPGVLGESARAVRLVALPVRAGAGAVSALCGALLVSEQLETVEPGWGMPCTGCLFHRSSTSQPGLLTEPAGDERSAGYRSLGWPVTIRRDQVLLTLGSDATALVMPVGLADRVEALLAERQRPGPVLVHPDVPEHRVFVAGEPFGVPLPWPPTVQVAAGTLSLPPSTTPRGPVAWHCLPDDHALRMCREIDIATAVHVVLHPRHD